VLGSDHADKTLLAAQYISDQKVLYDHWTLR